MKFEEALPLLRAGKKIGRKSWNGLGMTYVEENGKKIFSIDSDVIDPLALFAEDFQIID